MSLKSLSYHQFNILIMYSNYNIPFCDSRKHRPHHTVQQMLAQIIINIHFNRVVDLASLRSPEAILWSCPSTDAIITNAHPLHTKIKLEELLAHSFQSLAAPLPCNT
jgi:hypothetical protein